MKAVELHGLLFAERDYSVIQGEWLELAGLRLGNVHVA